MIHPIISVVWCSVLAVLLLHCAQQWKGTGGESLCVSDCLEVVVVMSVATKCYGTMQPSSSVISVIPGRPGASADSIDSVESAPDLFNPPIESPLRRSSVIAAVRCLFHIYLRHADQPFSCFIMCRHLT